MIVIVFVRWRKNFAEKLLWKINGFFGFSKKKPLVVPHGQSLGGETKVIIGEYDLWTRRKDFEDQTLKNTEDETGAMAAGGIVLYAFTNIVVVNRADTARVAWPSRGMRTTRSVRAYNNNDDDDNSNSNNKNNNNNIKQDILWATNRLWCNIFGAGNNWPSASVPVSF